MLSTLEKLNNEKDYLTLKIKNYKKEIHKCSEQSYWIQSSKLIDERNIYIAFKIRLEKIIKEYEKE